MMNFYLNELYSKNIDVAYAEAKSEYKRLRKVLIIKDLVLTMQVIGVVLFIIHGILYSISIVDRLFCVFLFTTLFYNIFFIKTEAIIGGWHCKAKLRIKDYEEIIPYEKFRKNFILDKKLMNNQITQDEWKVSKRNEV